MGRAFTGQRVLGPRFPERASRLVLRFEKGAGRRRVEVGTSPS